MSRFFCEDLIEFKVDRSITGVVYTTWSEVEAASLWPVKGLYIHSSTPRKILRTWAKEQRLLSGYVIVEFMLPGDGFCLVQEDEIRLRDRPLFLGSIVKRNASDQQSGRVMSVSATCALRPVCSVEEYARACPISFQVDSLIDTLHPNRPHRKSLELQGVPKVEQAGAPASYHDSDLVVSMGDVRNFQEFRGGDYVIYQNSIGIVTGVRQEVSVRLANGSVVVVEDPAELEIPLYVPGSSSHTLAQRLGLAGYNISCQKTPKTFTFNNFEAGSVAWYFPGQYVQTKKGNLRRGKWKFGAYDPDIEPRGLIVDLRIVELELEIQFPDYNGGDRLVGPSSSITLTTDDLDNGKVKLIDQSRLPSNPLAKSLGAAIAEADNEYGRLVRLKDVIAASLKHAGKWSAIPRTETQGYDMNGFHVTSTQCKALVFWQDGSFSEEETVSLIPLVELDQNCVWPGDKVSLKADEITLNSEQQEGISQLHTRTVGVVQTVDAIECLAKVRWFQNSDIKIDLIEDDFKRIGSPSLDYGTIGDQISEVSLYEIFPYGAFEPNIGDLALSLSTCASSYPQVSDPWGQVVELCLDGDIILRCFNAPEPYDLKVGSSNMIVIFDEDIGEGWDNSDDSFGEEEENNRITLGPIDVKIEYQGGHRMDVDGDEDAWSTDNDMSISYSTSSSTCRMNENGNDSRLQEKDKDMENVVTTNDDKSEINADMGKALIAQAVTPGSIEDHPNELPQDRLPENPKTNPESPNQNPEIIDDGNPSSFQILEGSPPSDHHYLNDQSFSDANLARVITKQYKILQSSLPEGIFVRTWESRLDLLRVLILGPVGTPYEHAPFLFDIYLPLSFPDCPPVVFFHSWDNFFGRMNPNLYEDGKVCLSLLGTWPADEKTQGWSKRSTILQVLVSITGLILVKEPYYNETGYEVLMGSETSTVASRIYSEKVFIMAKAFVTRALLSPPNGLKDVIKWLYCAPSGPHLLSQIIHEYRLSSLGLAEAFPNKASGGNALSDGEEVRPANRSWAEAVGRLSTGARIALEKHMNILVEYEEKVKKETSDCTH